MGNQPFCFLNVLVIMISMEDMVLICITEENVVLAIGIIDEDRFLVVMVSTPDEVIVVIVEMVGALLMEVMGIG